MALKVLLCSGDDELPQHRSVLRAIHTLNSPINYIRLHAGAAGMSATLHLAPLISADLVLGPVDVLKLLPLPPGGGGGGGGGGGSGGVGSTILDWDWLGGTCGWGYGARHWGRSSVAWRRALQWQ
jgi:hypothetical protein